MSRKYRFAPGYFAVLVGTATVFAACHSSSSDNGNTSPLTSKDASADFAACDTQHVAPNGDGDTLIICDKPFAAAPYIHMPDDDRSTDVVTLYAAIDLTNVDIVLRDGTKLALMDDSGTAISMRETSTNSNALPASLRMPSNRGMYTLYRLTGTIGQTGAFGGGTLPAFHVVSGSPVVMVPGNILDGSLLGVWEGTTNARDTDMNYTSEEIPVRIRLGALTPGNALDVWEYQTPLPDGTTFNMTGMVENFDHAVKGSDGTCYPALNSLGEKNPFIGATNGAVSFYRMSGMHFLGDQRIVVVLPAASTGWTATGMDYLGPFQVANWISPTGFPALTFKPHGLSRGNALNVHHIDGTAGGDGC